jgi:dTDP-4-dehydrorhamnose reductase
MRLLVTGAGGMLGQDVVAAARAAGHDVVGLARAELDVTSAREVHDAVSAARPDAVLNCAAFTDVDGAEAAEERAAAVNGAGAGHVAAAAAAAGALVVHVSTDYVFDGRAHRPYREDDPAAPLGAYGRTKRAGEEAVAAAAPRHAIARTSWLFGPGGRNFVDTMLRLGAEREEVAVVVDQVGLPTYTGHLAAALVDLAEREALGVHHMAGGGEPTSWNGLAREAFAQAGLRCRVRPATTAEMARPAPRPAWSVLGVTRAGTPRLPDWREGLRAHLARALVEARPA